MPNPGLSDAQLQEAVDWLEQYGTVMAISKALGMPYKSIEHRVKEGQRAGKKPTRKREEIKPAIRQRLGRVHLVIPDIQAKPNVSHDHLEWIANYAIEKRPDVIVQIGDWADMPSLSLYDKGKRCYEGRRYVNDINAANYSLERFERTLEDYNRTHPEDPFNPRKVLTRGNHEHRIERATMLDATLHEKLTLDDMDFERRGWECHDFLKIVTIDGIEYSHYFTSGVKGFPVASATTLLRERQSSATMGHVQHTDMAFHKKTQKIGLFCGICYLHDEDYLGPQGNTTRRQIVMKHEVEEGRYDPMFVSLRFLEKRYS